MCIYTYVKMCIPFVSSVIVASKYKQMLKRKLHHDIETVALN